MKKEHITLRLDEALLRDLDALAGSQHKDRSELISELLSGAVHPAPRGPGEPGPGQPAPGKSVPLPEVLKIRLGAMEKRRVECEDEAQRRKQLFWGLTLPPLAINAGFGTGLLGAKGSVVLHFISTMIMLVEKERPQNRLYTAYEKAALEFAQLEVVMAEQWQSGCAAGKDQRALLAQILAAQEKEEDRLARALESAEAFLKQSTVGGRIKRAAAKTFEALRLA